MTNGKFSSLLAGVPRISGWVLSGAAALAALSPCGARADTVVLGGSGAMPSYSYQYVAPNSTTPTVGDNYDLAVPGQYTFTDTFTTQQSLTQNLGTSSVGAYDFQDSYEFTVSTSASGDTLLASLGLGTLFDISNLQFRLYQVSGPNTQPIVGGLPSGSTSVTVWQGLAPGQNSMTASFSGIQSGTYILDVAGIASGTGGGSYVGSVDLEPVPLPAALWLMLSGLGGLGALSRKRAAA
ncbi:MAG: FxDxF family PEP-CTERM protein [Steroidobacteraceae bacterium]